jgi:signal transduction histidine kinase/CheY-like chemotaxis protein/HPt (histidine-containing phosphotransfer) domain-containing protein
MNLRAHGGRRLSLRSLLAGLLGVLGVLVAALLVIATLQLSGARAQSRAENRRTTSFLLADSMRQSSNDLTNMVRLYVSTGDPRYRGYYNEILAIRAGSAPRPRYYNSSFWNRVLAEGTGFVRYGKPQSLIDQMRAVDFTADEFAALADSLRASNSLAKRELDVMDRVEPRIRRGVDDAYFADVYPDYRRLVDHTYLAQKGVIMAAIDRFIALVDQRTTNAVDRVRSHNRNLVRAEIGVLILIALVGLAALVVLTRLAVRPLSRLIAATRRIAAGDYEDRVEIRAVSELERVADSFNEMGASIQADASARAAAEREAVEARAAAEHANQAKSTFLAAMSHEIRTPMIGVTGMLEVLAQTELTPQQRQMLATAESSAQALLQIIGDVLDFSKIEAEKLELAPTTFDVRPLVAAAVETFVHSASAKGLLLTWSADDRLAPTHVGDALRLRQILSNFVSNAVKFTEVGGIEVAVRVPDQSAAVQIVEFSVTDTGMGVPPEQQRRLFQEFGQAEASTSSRFGGTGLGLVICKRLALLMDGDVTMTSSEGKGTIVRLTVPLPLGDPDAIDARPRSAPVGRPVSRPRPDRRQAELEGSLLLLAEDHPVNRNVLGHQLAIIGFEVDLAGDGREAFEKYLSGGYALVLTDLAMPQMDGFELARAIRRHEQERGAARTPIVALSANVMEGEPERCRAAGMDDFAAKPTTIPFLAGKLQRWLPHLVWPEEHVAQRLDDIDDGTGPVRAGDGGPIDSAVLDELTGGDNGLAVTIVNDFVTASHEDLRGLELALAECDLDAVRRQAHRLKGAARMVGAHAIGRLAQQIEQGAAQRSDDWARYTLIVTQLAKALSEIALPAAQQ